MNIRRRLLSCLVLLMCLVVVPVHAGGTGPALTRDKHHQLGPGDALYDAHRRKQNLVTYKGSIYAIFFHPLIIYPSRAFNGPKAKGMNEWMITAKEFKRILPQLLAHNYVLVNVYQLFDIQRNDQGQVTAIHRKNLKLPPGKKPLLLSIDDLNYYHYMHRYGCADKLVLNAQGQVTAQSTNLNGQIVQSRDDGIVPLLDQFVARHPSFSHDGAKGAINLTGYQGILGYRTNRVGRLGYDQEVQQAERVVSALKEDGWVFTSHSWGHRDDPTISYQAFVNDTNRWLRQVEPIVGQTPVYVYPFGARVKTGGKKMQYLQSKGFAIFEGVGPHARVKIQKNRVMFDRLHVDGMSLETQHHMLKPYLNASQVIDHVRPEFKKNNEQSAG